MGTDGLSSSALESAASAGTTTVRNPINLARVIMDQSPHVMMAGVGADTYAKEQNKPISSQKIAEKLIGSGFEIPDRTIRFNLLAMDKDGFTEYQKKHGQ